MAATVTIRRHTGTAGSQTKTDITSINSRANAEDAHTTAGTTNPIKIPAAGSNYSYWVSTRLSADTTPAGTINNLRWYTDGSNNFGTGVTCVGAKASTGTNAGYRQATGTPGETGTELSQANHTGLDEAPANVFTHTVGSPKSLTGTISNPNTGDFGDFMVYQIVIGTTAAAGATATETLSWKYDET